MLNKGERRGIVQNGNFFIPVINKESRLNKSKSCRGQAKPPILFLLQEVQVRAMPIQLKSRRLMKLDSLLQVPFLTSFVIDLDYQLAK